jgi:PBP4 family serine-type D-alanyl-D-alanine carboxypeptidase
VGALSLNDNCVDVLYEGGDEGAPAKITLRPDTGYVTVKNTSTNVKAPKRPFVIYRKKGTNEVVVSGEIKAGAKQQVKWVAIHDPTRYFGTVLKETLEKAGIEVGGLKEADTLLGDHADLKVVAVHESDLARTLEVCNRSSQNFYAEMLCKTLGSKVVGAGTTAAGVATITTWLKSIGIEDADLSDGSGLSRKNRCSAGSLAKLLAWWTSQKDFKVFLESLPVSGTDGTLKRRMESVAGKVRAKTGHINGVSSLSGYVETAGGRLAFSILVNGWKGGSADDFQDAVCEGLVPWK